MSGPPADAERFGPIMPQVEHLGFSGRAADTPVAASAADVELAAVAADGWPAIETEPLGPWLLRASFGFTLRGNSVLVTGRPQEHLLEAVSSIEAWYAARDLPPIFSLPTDAQGEMTDVALAALLAHRGYQSGEWVMTLTADTEQIIAAGREHPIWDAATPVRVEADLSPDWTNRVGGPGTTWSVNYSLPRPMPQAGGRA